MNENAISDICPKCGSTTCSHSWEIDIPTAPGSVGVGEVEPWKDAGGHAWELRPNTLCVECPHCLFTFAAIHVVEPADYDCPNCDGCPEAVPTPTVDIWKLVFDVISAESYSGTRHLIKQLEAARAGDWEPPQNSMVEGDSQVGKEQVGDG